MPLPKKEENDSKQDYVSKLVEHNMKKVDSLPGGRKQAIAIAESEAGNSKKSEDEEETEKALTSRSMSILKPRIDTSTAGIERSANRGITRQFSALVDPSQGAPLTGAFEAVRKADDEYVTCVSHGTMHKSLQGCYHCNLYKSTLCKTCDKPLIKGPGGTYRCSKGC